MIKSKPYLSVIMSVYNAEDYLSESIESILNQTYKDFEFIIIDDASTDGSLNLIKSFNDERIVLIEKTENKGFKGFVENLNIGLNISKGELIARMDADDICYPNRFEIQIQYLSKNPRVFMVGNSMDLIDESGKFLYKKNATIGFVNIVRQFNYTNPMFHPTLMFRKTSIRYRENFIGCEDFDFHLQHLSKGFIFENLSESLIKYRILNQSISRSTNKLKLLIGMEASRDSYLSRKYMDSNDELQLLNRYLENCLTQSDKRKILWIAIKYNSANYSEVLNKFNINDLVFKIFNISELRKLYSKIAIYLFKKVKL